MERVLYWIQGKGEGCWYQLVGGMGGREGEGKGCVGT